MYAHHRNPIYNVFADYMITLIGLQHLCSSELSKVSGHEHM